MKATSAKEQILKKIRKALSANTNLPFPNSEGNSGIYPAADDEAEVMFAEQFSRLQGRFLYCLNKEELTSALHHLIAHNKWQKLYCVEDVLLQQMSDMQITGLNNTTLHQCDVSFTSCEYLIARTGTIVMSTAQQSGRTTSVYAPVHVCIAYTNQLVYDIKDALQLLKEKYGAQIPSFITFATGPSRTADIEKTLVVGVHGPKEVYVLLVDTL